MELLNPGIDARQAYDIAKVAHDGQNDLQGYSYIFHPLHVAGVSSERLRAIGSHLSEFGYVLGMLHDTVEDSPLTIEDLVERGATPMFARCMVLISRNAGQVYDEYTDGLINADLPADVHLALLVTKDADVEHNMDPTRPCKGFESRNKRYSKTRAKLAVRIQELMEEVKGA